MGSHVGTKQYPRGIVKAQLMSFAADKGVSAEILEDA